MALIDTDLVVRYYVDEPASGITPTTVDDAGPATTQDLAIDYDAGTADLEYTEVSGNRGLEFKDAGGDQYASFAVGTSGKTYTAFNGTKVATLEVVCQVDTFSTSGGRVFGLQRLDAQQAVVVRRLVLRQNPQPAVIRVERLGHDALPLQINRKGADMPPVMLTRPI